MNTTNCNNGISDFYNWYVLHTFSGFEEKLRKIINATIGDSVTIFIPYKEIYHRIKGENIKIRKPLFPGYVFVYRDIEYLDMVSKNSFFKRYINPLTNNGSYSMVETKDMEFLFSLAGDSEVIEASKAVYNKDQRIIIIKGPLKDISGKIQFINRRKQKVKILVDLMEKQIPVTLGIDFIDDHIGRQTKAKTNN